MSHSTYFYATRNDLLPVLEVVEKEVEVQYVGTEWTRPWRKPLAFSSLTQYHGLGIAGFRNYSGCQSFLVTFADWRVDFNWFPTIYGPYKRALLGKNPGSVLFRPGGLYRKTVLICGELGSISEGPPEELYKVFHKAIVKSLKTRIHRFYLGEEAKALMDQGMRLTTDAGGNPLYDLAPALNADPEG